MNDQTIAIIPARYASTRFPGKPLADMLGKPMIQRVYERVAGVVGRAVVATDDDRIRKAVEAFGGEVVMTSPLCSSGTERCREAFDKIGRGETIILNLQGDEPFIQAEQIGLLISAFDKPETDIATLAEAFAPDTDYRKLNNPNSPKIVTDHQGYALYFSRSVIPYFRGEEPDTWCRLHTYYKHIGIYAFRPSVLREITDLPQSAAERAESLEQLRWLEHGYRIRVLHTKQSTIGIDTPEDMDKAIAFLRSTRMA
ncbi:3-deoxy-manno-octulosonate cytidylyltransferase [Porphyromonas loveana]|uniref:3-deoxy-manno-octulosonate cytidylyltransferase n=2 Tax=Porphyromonas loveana TaxID=1884669 RepID=UPI0035A1B7D2